MNATPRPTRALLAALACAIAAASVQAAPAGDSDDRKVPRAAKNTLDDRADPRMRLDDVGKGEHMGRKPLAAGAYFDDANRQAVRKYFSEHPPQSAGRAGWQIGQSLPTGAPVQPVPKGLLPSLPKVPPGLRYLAVGGDILLVANSGMVVDGISAGR